MQNNKHTAVSTPSTLDFDAITALLKKNSPEDKSGLRSQDLSGLLALAGFAPMVEKPLPKADVWGRELFISIRNTREFGMIISAGLGGEDRTLYQASFQPNQALVTAATALVDGKAFFNQFQQSFAYRKLLGAAADKQENHNSAYDQQLLECFSSLIELANHYAPSNPDAPFVIENFEIHPVLMDNLLLPTSAVCQFAQQKPVPAARPIAKIGKLLHPQSIGIIGVSATKMNFGRIILKNLIASGYDKSKMTIIRPGETEIDGIPCVESLQALDHKLDLFVVAVAADAVFGLVEEVIATDAAESVMLVPGGLGETEKSRAAAAEMVSKIQAAHQQPGGGPVFLGGNCLGVVSHAGGYDSWFIPQERLPKPQKKQQRNAALISQSGAFMITRLSKNPWLDPAYMAALGNQSDITHGDMIRYFADHGDIDTIGVYIEGFKDLDGLAFAQATRDATLKGKQVVVYKAGRTAAGQGATMGHTASIAGDYPLCEAVLKQAGALVAKDLTEFDDLFYIADVMRNKRIEGNRLGAVSGAGFEAVGMADSIHGASFDMQMASLAPATMQRIEETLVAKRLDALMEVRNPMDINPGADDEAHIDCTAAMAEDPNVDAVVVGLDPASPAMRALEKSARSGFDIHHEQSVVQLMPKLVAASDKPIIGIVDGGPLYDPMAAKLMDQGVCVFRSCERGVAALVRLIEARLYAQSLRDTTS